jgi:hypothetical protein
MTPIDRQKAAAASWSSFCDLLKTAGEELMRTDFPIGSLDLAEGLRYLSRLTFAAIERNVEGANPQRPLLYELCNERVKIGGDNPDNRYYAAAVDARYRYVLKGDFRRCTYFSVVASGRGDGSDAASGGTVNSRTAVVGSDGLTEIHIGREPRGAANHVALNDSTKLVIVRCTIETSGDRDIGISLERLDDGTLVDRQVRLDDVVLALQNAAQFVRNAAHYYGDWTARFQEHLNQLPIYPDQAQLVSLGGDPAIRIYLSAWALAPDECLVIELDAIPDCITWNFQLCNVWFESLDYTAAPVHLNSRNAIYRAERSATIVVSATDPGVPNWLRTLGHNHGTMCMRLVGASEPLRAETRVVKVSDLKAVAARGDETLSVGTRR